LILNQKSKPKRGVFDFKSKIQNQRGESLILTEQPGFAIRVIVAFFSLSVPLWSVSLKSNYQICYWFWNFIWFVVVFPKYYGTSSGFYRYIIVFVIVFRKII